MRATWTAGRHARTGFLLVVFAALLATCSPPAASPPGTGTAGISALRPPEGSDEPFPFPTRRLTRVPPTRVPPTRVPPTGGPPSTSRIDFEDLAPGTIVRTQYSSRGVVFPQTAYLSRHVSAHSGTQVLLADNPADEFHDGPMVIQFGNPVQRVSLYAGVADPSAPAGELRVYDSSGRLLGTDGPRPVEPSTVNTLFHFDATGMVIAKLELEIGITNFEAIDDLDFTGQGSGTSTAPPVVTISAPADGETMFVNALTIRGTVTGESLLPFQVRLTYRKPPPAQSGLVTLRPSLSGSGPAYDFSTSYGVLPIGPIVITAEAEDVFGQKGTASIAITNIPPAIVTRYLQTAGLGLFQYGMRRANCLIAVYEHGAIALSGTTTRVITGQIFSMWASLRPVLGKPVSASSDPGEIGCPLSEATGEAEPASQDFEYGRIVITSSRGALYVPRLFVEAMAATEGVDPAGLLPVANPTQEIHPAYDTPLFQRFVNADNTAWATLEIRGTPQKLYVERVLAAGSPALVDEYECSTADWTCDFAILVKEPLGAMGRYCGGEHYDWEGVKTALLQGTGLPETPYPPQWAAIDGDQVQTPVVGIVTSSGMTTGDNPFTHEYEYHCPPDLDDLLRWDPYVISGGLFSMSDGEPSFCESDWNVDVMPLPDWRDVLGEGRQVVHVEYEQYYSRIYELFALTQPQFGDLAFISGRWVVDCGHSYKTEIHPPGIVATMRPTFYQNHAATVANIWVTGWFTGGTVEFYIDPPPRPSPTAFLHAVEERHSMLNVSLTAIPALSRFLVRVTSPANNITVTGQSQMLWKPMLGGETRFYVYWSGS